MTDHDKARDDRSLDNKALDELVSAHLDGETTAEERARIEGDPDLRARLSTFASVRAAVATPPDPPSDESREAAIARAIGASIAPPRVVALRRRVEPARVIAVAAVILAIAFFGGAIALLADGTDRGDDQSASSDDGGDSAELSTAGLGAATTTAGTAQGTAEAPMFLGSFDDDDGLRAAVASANRAAAPEAASAEDSAGGASLYTSTVQGSAADTPGEAPPAPQCGDAGANVVYRAELAGEPVLVLVSDASVTVLRAADCAPLTSFAP